MRLIESSGPFILLILFGFWALFFSIWGVIFDSDWVQSILASYMILISISVTLIFLISTKTRSNSYIVREFEKTLEGGLSHFKCPSCNGIFAIKKSSRKNKKPVKLTCPDCGRVGIIPSAPTCIKEDIPAKKSVKADFKCSYCGEGITIWAEGAELHHDIRVYSCPFCGEEKTMVYI